MPALVSPRALAWLRRSKETLSSRALSALAQPSSSDYPCKDFELSAQSGKGHQKCAGQSRTRHNGQLMGGNSTEKRKVAGSSFSALAIAAIVSTLTLPFARSSFMNVASATPISSAIS